MDKVGRGHNESSGQTFLLKYHPRLHCPFRRKTLHPEGLTAPLCLVGQHLCRQLSPKILQENTWPPQKSSGTGCRAGTRYLL